MRSTILLFSAIVLLSAAVIASAQQPEGPQDLRIRETPQLEATPKVAAGMVTLPAGTKIPLVLKQAISTKYARVGDPVYAQTNFPVVQNDRMVIPPGTFVGRAPSAKSSARDG